MSSDFVKKALTMPHHPAIDREIDKLRDREAAALKDLVATEQERNYRPHPAASVLAEEYNRMLKQAQEKFANEITQYQNEINYAMLAGEMQPDSSKNQARINQEK